mmetsp:Transcript_77090/g.223031  ORF Transcript_77090/g.223031 Transcript_77090/m.223031 type:complete len:239 (-) Transcript_77090:321-1037(-)
MHPEVRLLQAGMSQEAQRPEPVIDAHNHDAMFRSQAHAVAHAAGIFVAEGESAAMYPDQHRLRCRAGVFVLGRLPGCFDQQPNTSAPLALWVAHFRTLLRHFGLLIALVLIGLGLGVRVEWFALSSTRGLAGLRLGICEIHVHVEREAVFGPFEAGARPLEAYNFRRPAVVATLDVHEGPMSPPFGFRERDVPKGRDQVAAVLPDAAAQRRIAHPGDRVLGLPPIRGGAGEGLLALAD